MEGGGHFYAKTIKEEGAGKAKEKAAQTDIVLRRENMRGQLRSIWERRRDKISCNGFQKQRRGECASGLGEGQSGRTRCTRLGSKILTRRG